MDQPTNDQLIAQLGVGTGTFAAKMAEIAGAAMLSDQQGQMAHLAYLQGVSQLPPLLIEQTEDIGFGLGSLTRRDQRAAFTGVNLSRLAFESVDMDFNMRVGSHTEAATERGSTVKSDTEAEGSVGFLWFKARAKQTLSAEVRNNSKNTRSTDMSAEVNIRGRLSREEPPEGLMMMADTANEFSRRMNDLRMKIATAKIDSVIEKIENGEIDPMALEDAPLEVAVPEAA